jgi:glycogen synthase
MRVLMFGWELPPHNSGGLGIACHELAKSLASKNVQLTFVLPRRLSGHIDDVRTLYADVDNVVFEYIDSSLMPYVTSEGYKIMVDAETGVQLYGPTLFEEVKRYALNARKIAKKEKFDLIHAHDWLSFPAGVEARKVSNKPLVSHVHSTEYDRTGGGIFNSEVYKVEKDGLQRSNRIIAVSNYTKQIIASNYQIDAGKINVVHNGIAYDGFKWMNENTLNFLRENGNKLVIFVGRITLQKGPDYFLKVAKKVLEHYPKAVFIMSGSGDMENQVIREAANLGVSDKVLFAGFLRGEDLGKLYQSADLFVMPSVSEPFGIAPLEAIVNGTPVLISKQSGVSEVLTHSLKADFWDVDDMTDKIVSVLENDSLKNTLKENSMNEVKKVNWDSAASKVVDLYNDVLNN